MDYLPKIKGRIDPNIRAKDEIKVTTFQNFWCFRKNFISADIADFG